LFSNPYFTHISIMGGQQDNFLGLVIVVNGGNNSNIYLDIQLNKPIECHCSLLGYYIFIPTLIDGYVFTPKAE
jgi:hypothetical protein